MRELRIVVTMLASVLAAASSPRLVLAQEVGRSPQAGPVRSWDMRQGEKGGSIEATLVDATGAVKPNCSIAVFEIYGVEVASGLTGPTGIWASTNLRPGKYVVRAACQWFVTQLRVVRLAVDRTRVLRFEMVVRPTVDFITIESVEPPANSASVRLQRQQRLPRRPWTGIEIAVQDDKGQPVSKADVALTDAAGRSVSIVNRADGAWSTIPPLEPGRYEVSILADGFWFQQFEDVEVLAGRPTKLEAKLAPVLSEDFFIRQPPVEVEPSPESSETVK